MPWTHKDAMRHTKHASTDGQQHRWAKIANRVLVETGDEGRAVKIANAAVHPKGKGKVQS